MKKKLNILMVASEVVPFAKTGGLADVAGALPIYLKRAGHEVRVVMPKYASINSSKFQLEPFHSPMGVWMGNHEEWCQVHRAFIEKNIPVYFIDHDIYFNREGLYHDKNMNDYLDNPRRYAFFSRAALQLCIDLDFRPDIVHSNDWQTALCSAYLKVWHKDTPALAGAASVLTIHNIAYQGKYPMHDYDYTGLRWDNFHPDALEDFGNINFLKGGIFFSDVVNTVSPGYARETRTPLGSHGLAPYLNNKGEDYFGILNGIDYVEWSPESDTLIPAKYSAKDLSGKKLCKQELQSRLGLTPSDRTPVVGVVSRFADQKGLHLLAEIIDSLVSNMEVQFAILGSGDKGLEHHFAHMAHVHPGKIGTYIGYSNELAHLIEAGSDFFVMPSIYEPCGLNQIYSLKYGTLPIVRATGGLDDTIDQYDESTGAGTGFKFDAISASALYDTIGWAISTYFDRPLHYLQLQQNAMQQVFSWEKSTQQYLAAYQQALSKRAKLKKQNFAI